MAESPLIRKLRERARSVGGRAASAIFERSTKNDAHVNAAFRTFQAGRRTLDENATRFAESLGLATREDLDTILRRMGRLRKRLQSVLDELDP